MVIYSIWLLLANFMSAGALGRGCRPSGTQVVPEPSLPRVLDFGDWRPPECTSESPLQGALVTFRRSCAYSLAAASWSSVSLPMYR